MMTCSRCGASFTCAMQAGLDTPCWCTALPPLMPVPGQQAACWCPDCLRAQSNEQRRRPAPPTSAGA